MLPAWLSLGDHENIFMYRRLVDKELEVQEECELTTIHRTANIFKHPDLIAAAAETSSGSSFEWPKSVELGRYDGILGDPRDNNWTSSDDKKDMPPGETVALGLMACFGPDRRKTSSTSPSSQLQRNIHRLLFDHEGTHINRLPLTLLPGTAPTEAMETDDEGAPDPEPSTRLFHIDDEGKTCFSREEAEAASQLVADMALDERVKQSIQHKRFVLPQQTQNIDGGFCNEAVYGRLNLLTVTGLVRLDSAKPIKAPSVKVAFDAWPSAKTLTDSAHKTFARHGAYGVVKGWQEGEMKDAYSAWY